MEIKVLEEDDILGDDVVSTLPVHVDAEVVEQQYPICSSCKEKLDQIKFLDYGEVRVIFHANKGCVIGTINA